MPGALGIGAQSARHLRMLERFLDAKKDRFAGEETLLHADRGAEGIDALLGRHRHDAQQRTPVHHPAAREMTGVGVEQPDLVGGDHHIAGLVEPASAGPAEHLQDLVGPQRLFGGVTPVGFARQRDAAQGEVNARRQAHGRDDHAQLAGLGQGFDDAGTCAVAEAAVVIGDAALEHLGQVLAHQLLLRGRELERVGIGQLAHQFRRHLLGRLPARGEDEDRPQILGQRLGHRARPIAAHLGGQMIADLAGVDFVQRHGPLVMPDRHRIAAQAPEPFHHVLRIADAAAEQEQLGVGRRQRNGDLVVQPALRVGDHLVFVDDQQRRAFAADEPVFLGLERGDEHGRGKVLGQVAGGDADIPAARPPLGQLVVGQGPRRHGVDCLPARPALVGPDLENEGLARARRCLHDDVPALAQGADGLLLPEVGDDHLAEPVELLDRWGETGHARKIADCRGTETGILRDRLRPDQGRDRRGENWIEICACNPTWVS